MSIGTCLGKFTKSGKFRLGITALDYMNEHALHKVWVKPSAELSFLYGNNIVKSGLARITERVPQYGGVVVYSMNNLPMGKVVDLIHVDENSMIDLLQAALTRLTLCI